MLTEEERFFETVGALNFRSQFHLQVIQPRIADAGIKEGADITKADLKNALGEHSFLIR